MTRIAKVITVTPTIEAAAYGDADRLGSIMTLSDAFAAGKGTVELSSITVLDKAKQKSAIDVLFFSELPTVASADNAALSITDAEMAKYIGRVAIPAAGYEDTADSSDTTVRNIGLVMQAAAGSTSLYAIVQCQGTPTYTSTSDLTLKFSLVQD